MDKKSKFICDIVSNCSAFPTEMRFVYGDLPLEKNYSPAKVKPYKQYSDTKAIIKTSKPMYM